MQHPALSRLRLLLIAGCLVVAAASALSDLQMHLRAPLVGAFLVAAVLLLALGRDSTPALTPDLSASGANPAEEPLATEEPPAAQRRFRRREGEELSARVSGLVGQLDEYEKKLAEISRAQKLAEISTRHELGRLREQIAHLEAVNEQQHATIDSLRQQQAQSLQRLQHTVADQREALAGLESALELELASPPER